MTRFVQPVSGLADPYQSDPVLRSWLDRLLGPDRHAAAAPRLAALSAEVTGPLRAAHTDAENNPPVLVRYDGWGARVDRVLTSPGWAALRDAAARHGLVATAYRAADRDSFGAGARVVQHALLHLYGPESATFTCPVAMADGAAALLHRPDVEAPGDWLSRLTSTDPGIAVTSGQWMTESQGGSNLAGTTTTATRTGTGWRLTGEKWFCSAIDSAMSVTLARPAGPDSGSSRVLAPFLVPRYADGADRPADGIRLHRLKDKLGTRAVPTAEVSLDGARALPLGDPGSGGLSRMMTLVVVTRLHNAAAAAAGLRRGLQYAEAYARDRVIAGGRLWDNPLHRATLVGLEVDARGTHALAAHAFALLGRAEVDADADDAEELRLVAPLAKLTTGKLAVGSASELLECFGGAGYVEDTGIPRLLRDAQVLPIWEGTTNVLSVDVLRALGRGAGVKPLRRRLETATELLEPVEAGVPGAASVYTGAVRRTTADLDAAGRSPTAPAVVATARSLALRAGLLLAAALLIEHAAWASARGDSGPAVAAGLWTLHHLGGVDIAELAYRHSDQLLTG